MNSPYLVVEDNGVRTVYAYCVSVEHAFAQRDSRREELGQWTIKRVYVVQNIAGKPIAELPRVLRVVDGEYVG